MTTARAAADSIVPSHAPGARPAPAPSLPGLPAPAALAGRLACARQRVAMAAAIVAVGMMAIQAARAADDKPASAGAAKPGPAAPAPAAKAALTVTVTQPQRGSLPLAVAANGNVAAWQEALVGSEAAGLRLVEVAVNVGDRVRRGQVLARFAADMQQADLAQARAALAEAEALNAEAGANAQRARDLATSGALSAQQVNQYLTAERTAQARLEAQRAALKVQQLRLAHTQVLAPDDGLISARSATVGAVVGAGQELFRLIRQGRLEWRAEVAAADLALLQPGMAVRVTPAGGAAVAGRVRMVAPTVDAATRNGLVYVDLPQPGAARAGMFARGEFQIGSSAALTLPASAVLLRDGFSYVFQLAADSKVRQVKVGVGRRLGENVEITAGLDPAARVVTAGAGFLGDGDIVRVVAAPPPIVAPAPAAAAGPK
jgi:RND family efflux transporter MFP subunit